MQQQYRLFTEKLFANRHAEVPQLLKEGEECWFLPAVKVYHQQKPNHIQVVSDSCGQYLGVFPSDVLLTHPDLNNSLLGVYLRFQKERVLALADIQQMFCYFQLQDDHCNFLCVFWRKDDNVANEVIDYQMKVHVLGNGLY